MRRNQTILIVEDSPHERTSYVAFARELGLHAFSTGAVAEALSLLSRESVDFLLTDIHLSLVSDSCEGLGVLEYARREHPGVTCLAMSADPNVVVFERAIASGAQHFLKKPILNADDLAIAIDVALERKRVREEKRRQEHDEVRARERWPEGIVISPEHLRQVESAARNSELPVVIYGETGTGKEEIAKLVHRKRRAGEGMLPLVIVNCANLSETLLESALFGHKRGAFSGATETTTGFVGEADGGLLFLDEIHTLSLKCQQKLLRVLNDGSYQRLGDTKTLFSHFQVIAATTRDLDEEVDRGNFLLDLRTRLSGIEVFLKPLRERKEELGDFIELFFARANVEIGRAELARLVERCRRYHWRGNVRQLFMALQVMVAISKDSGAGLSAEHLPEFRTMLAPQQQAATAVQAPAVASVSEEYPFLRALREDMSFHEAVEGFEAQVLRNAAERHGGNWAQVSMALRIGRSSLDLKRRKFGLGRST